MTNMRIADYYKWLSVVTLIVSIVGPMALVDGTIIEKLGIGLLVNLQFHLAFQFLSRVPFAMYQFAEKANPQIKTMGYPILKIFSWFIMIASIIGLVGFLYSVFTNHQYDQLIATMTLIAVFLGGYSLNLKLREN